MFLKTTIRYQLAILYMGNWVGYIVKLGSLIMRDIKGNMQIASQIRTTEVPEWRRCMWIWSKIYAPIGNGAYNAKFPAFGALEAASMGIR